MKLCEQTSRRLSWLRPIGERCHFRETFVKCPNFFRSALSNQNWKWQQERIDASLS